MIVRPVRRFAERLSTRVRFPRLLIATVLLFVVDLIAPDVVPFVDEILLGLLTGLLATLRRKPEEKAVRGEE